MSSNNESKSPRSIAQRELSKRRRDRGLCVRCAAPALRSRERGLDVNRRLANGGGLPNEYVRATRGHWRAGDPIPTLEFLTHEPLCASCKRSASKSVLAANAKRAAAREKMNQHNEKTRRAYLERATKGVCRRCGVTPLPSDADTVECGACRKRREERAMESPRANDIADRLIAGQSQISIRLELGEPRSIIEPIAAVLRRTGKLKTRRTGPLDPRLVDRAAELFAAGESYDAIGEIVNRTPRTVQKWLHERSETRRSDQ